jgi:hypothetical protein
MQLLSSLSDGREDPRRPFALTPPERRLAENYRGVGTGARLNLIASLGRAALIESKSIFVFGWNFFVLFVSSKRLCQGVPHRAKTVVESRPTLSTHSTFIQ